MAAQTTYGFKTTAGAPGGIVDLSPYQIDTFLNEAKTGEMKFGFGVVRGENANGCKIPASGAKAADFLGVAVNNRSTEFDLEGNIHIREKTAIGVMRYGRVYVRTAKNITIKAGEPAYLIADGEDAGKFTNAKGSNVEVAGAFVGPADSHDIAAIDLFNAPAPAASGAAGTSYTLPNASSSSLGGVKVGKGLSIDGSGVLSVKAATSTDIGGVTVGDGLKIEGDKLSTSEAV